MSLTCQLSKPVQNVSGVFTGKQRWSNLIGKNVQRTGMGGRKCLEQLLRINPGIKVLVASGYAADVQVRQIVEAGVKGFLRKPYNVRQMLREVRRVLDVA